LNKNLEFLVKKFFISKKAIDNLLKGHNYMCNTIQEFNIFWKNIYLSLILGSFPITALILHQIFFEDLPEYTLWTLTAAISVYLTILFMTNRITAEVLKRVIKSYKLLHKLYVKLRPSNRNRRKFKLSEAIISFFKVILKILLIDIDSYGKSEQ